MQDYSLEALVGKIETCRDVNVVLEATSAPGKRCLELLIDRLRASDYPKAIELARWSDAHNGTGFNLDYKYLSCHDLGLACAHDCSPSVYEDCELADPPFIGYLQNGHPLKALKAWGIPNAIRLA